jgi:6-pyruvoyltetrahydropterin/6-carboxytetrahydropterin synthase
MYEITVEKDFAAAHRLMEYDGNCENLHGHNWRVALSIQTDRLDSLGLALDFRKAKRMLKDVLSCFDHAYLNDLELFENRNPSCEQIARHVFKSIKERLQKTPEMDHLDVSNVTVWESAGTSVTYHEND